MRKLKRTLRTFLDKSRRRSREEVRCAVPQNAQFPFLTVPGWATDTPLARRTCIEEQAPLLSESERAEVITQIAGIVFDFFLAGYALRAIDARRLHWINGEVVLSDLGHISQYPSQTPAFAESYDLTGQGMESPEGMADMHICSDSPHSLGSVLQVTSGDITSAIEERVWSSLLDASRSFEKAGERHTPHLQRVYGSFALPYFSVPPAQAQRDSAKRVTRFGITPSDICNKRILDLGCHIGNNLFEIQSALPGKCLGVEYDWDKVHAARAVAAYNGLNNVSFVRGDVDQISASDIAAPYDIVFCLAIEAHVRDPDRLYNLLKTVTGETLYFEGNGTTDPELASQKLRHAGFSHVTQLGFCDDDARSSNNNRPLLVAQA